MNRIRIILLALALLAAPLAAAEPDGEAASTCRVAIGALADNMANRVTRTVEIGYHAYATSRYRYGKVKASISIEKALPATCATWAAEIILPAGVTLESKTGNEARREGLAHDARPEWELAFSAIHVGRGRTHHPTTAIGERRRALGAIAVEVYAGSDTPVSPRDVSTVPGIDGAGRWHFPVEFVWETSAPPPQ